MKPIWIFNIVGGAVACLIGAAYYFEIGPYRLPLVHACEASLIKRLKTPSTYARIVIEQSERVLTEEEFQAARLEKRNLLRSSAGRDSLQLELNSDMQAIRAGSLHPKLYTAQIEYDAQNGYGALIRSRAGCAFMPPDGKLDRVSEWNVEVDGETTIEFLSRQLQEAR